MDTFKQQWQAREPKEQLIIALLLFAVVAVLLWLFAYKPVSEWNQRQQSLVERNSKTLAEVNQLVAQIKSRQANNSGEPSAGNLAEVVDRTLSNNNIKMGGFQPNKDGIARLRLDNVSYESLVQWFHDLEYKEQVQILEANISQAQTAGLLMVNMRLRKP